MLLRTWVIVRTLFLLVAVGYALWAVPWVDKYEARCNDAIRVVRNAAWIAIAWIALEALVGWVQVWRAARAARAANPPAPAPPPAGR